MIVMKIMKNIEIQCRIMKIFKNQNKSIENLLMANLLKLKSNKGLKYRIPNFKQE